MYKQKIKELTSKSLSGDDVLKICNNTAAVYTYPQLTKFKDIDDLLGKYGAVICLYLTNENYGHWCTIHKLNDDTICFFDPYGLMPDDELKFTKEHFRKSHKQWFPHLTWLLLKCSDKYKIDYNNHKLQSKKNNTATCGRWAGARIAFRHLTNDQFAKLFMRKGKVKPDEYVTALTSFV